MTIEEAERIIRGITYKTGWKITANMRGNLFSISLVYPGLDSRPEFLNESVKLGNNFSCDLQFLTEQILLCNVQELIKKTELHESDEWLRYQGKLLRDPHA